MSCPREMDVGPYVLDALEPPERLRVAGHLWSCTVCTRTLTELGTVPSLLATVTPEEVDREDPIPSDLAFRRLRRAGADHSGGRLGQRPRLGDDHRRPGWRSPPLTAGRSWRSPLEETRHGSTGPAAGR